MEHESKPKKSKGLIATIIILILIIIGLCTYIAYDKGIIFKSSADVEEKKEKTKKEVKKEEPKEEEQEEIDYVFDDSKVVNNNSGNKYRINGNGSNLGISTTINDDKKSVDVTVIWSRINENYGTAFHPEVEKYQGLSYNINFNQEVANIYTGYFGQDTGEEKMFFLMKDKTVEYMPIKEACEKTEFKSYGKIEGLDNVIGFTGASVYSPEGPGWVSTLAIKEDGTFYDLGNVS